MTDRRSGDGEGHGRAGRDHSPTVPEFRRRIEVSGLGRRTVHVPFAATETERAAIARHLGLVALEVLEGEVAVRHWRAGAALSGRLHARVVQTCVVTLDPIASEIEQSFERRYLPADRLEHDIGHMIGEIDIAPDEEDAPEPLIGNGIELGDAVVEELALALDPFPRSPDARLERQEGGEEEELHPFAVLAKLKR